MMPKELCGLLWFIEKSVVGRLSDWGAQLVAQMFSFLETMRLQGNNLILALCELLSGFWSKSSWIKDFLESNPDPTLKKLKTLNIEQTSLVLLDLLHLYKFNKLKSRELSRSWMWFLALSSTGKRPNLLV
ncbi:hypothetical protein BJP34_28360 [Moorena producens PAL-8-15-08-1]|uniref:Uncharacterized protein n=1 Tax=Moorena producens PAL-8-15-08-1 TaxID=1458985 RepID=A0A1D8TYV3_9CYAN|nr:hypothetical protein BJP34_28360 [Moorena producens PAL-8-15-08-1]